MVLKFLWTHKGMVSWVGTDEDKWIHEPDFDTVVAGKDAEIEQAAGDITALQEEIDALDNIDTALRTQASEQDKKITTLKKALDAVLESEEISDEAADDLEGENIKLRANIKELEKAIQNLFDDDSVTLPEYLTDQLYSAMRKKEL